MTVTVTVIARHNLCADMPLQLPPRGLNGGVALLLLPGSQLRRPSLSSLHFLLQWLRMRCLTPQGLRLRRMYTCKTCQLKEREQAVGLASP